MTGDDKMKNVPSKKEYSVAKVITNAYEAEQQRLFAIKLDAFKKELAEYFNAHKVCGHTITDFRLDRRSFGGYEITPWTPSLEECYCGENDSDINEIGRKYGIEISFVLHMYHK